MNKKGVSVIIGYVLLIVFAMVIGVIVYKSIKTYVPKDVPKCPESVSIFINDLNYTEDFKLNISLTNNGLFDIAGYFIYATNNSNQELATKDLSEFFKSYPGDSVTIANKAVLIVGLGNPMAPGDTITNSFESDEDIYSIEIIPVRFQEEENKERFVSCGGSKAVETTQGGTSGSCTPESSSTTCGTWVCGDRTNNCGTSISCGTCSGENVCNSTGQCITPEQCTDTCESLGYGCETHTICGSSVNCGDCLSSEVCNSTWQCEIACGNGDMDTGEECDDGDTDNSDGCSSICTVELGWECTGEPSSCENIGGAFNSCGDYCSLFGYSSNFACQDNPNKCAPPQGPTGGIYIGDVEGANQTIGDSFCSGDPYCCCVP